jgi:hypothetical protein
MPTLRRILKYTPATLAVVLLVTWLVNLRIEAQAEAEVGSKHLKRPIPLYYSRQFGVGVPIIVAVTAMLPLAIGPFLSFRFRLWHYLAYTALVAVELAYYLRWQG